MPRNRLYVSLIVVCRGLGTSKCKFLFSVVRRSWERRRDLMALDIIRDTPLSMISGYTENTQKPPNRGLHLDWFLFDFACLQEGSFFTGEVKHIGIGTIRNHSA